MSGTKKIIVFDSRYDVRDFYWKRVLNSAKLFPESYFRAQSIKEVSSLKNRWGSENIAIIIVWDHSPGFDCPKTLGEINEIFKDDTPKIVVLTADSPPLSDFRCDTLEEAGANLVIFGAEPHQPFRNLPGSIFKEVISGYLPF